MKKVISICFLAIFSSNVFALSPSDNLTEWYKASYSEQTKLCKSIAKVLKKSNVTTSGICDYLSEMARGGALDFEIAELAAMYATVAK